MITKIKKSNDATAYLKTSVNKILNYLRKIVSNKKFNYRTFGTSIEEHLTDILVKLFTEGGFIENNKDYVVALNKNYFPDFELKTTPPLAIEFKSGNKSQYRKEKWVVVKNSENDMGTLNEWPQKIKKFGGDNIYYIFVIYNFNDQTEEVLNVEIAPFYQFIGLNKGKVLKYREKDGNLRPKDFESNSPIKTLKQFEDLLNKTVIYRSKRVIKKHRSIIKKVAQTSKKELG
ncbi:hypothetical protein C4553_03575 [Candidatus Parcubacteria bacterium]|nr:MAG: hypothetical protein C4553_03575 [Candidatus Parcubacteria bacterium]